MIAPLPPPSPKSLENCPFVIEILVKTKYVYKSFGNVGKFSVLLFLFFFVARYVLWVVVELEIVVVTTSFIMCLLVILGSVLKDRFVSR